MIAQLLSPISYLGEMLATFGKLAEFHVAFNIKLWWQEEEVDEEEAMCDRGG